MIKKENGVTLTILLVTIVIMIILAGVIMSISMSLTKTSDIKEIVANMELIRGVASDYRNKYLDDSEIERDDNNNITSIKVSTKFIGTKEDPHQANSIIQQLLRSTYLDSEFLNLLSQEKGWYWYRLDKTDLDKMGLNNIDLDNEAYLVNYYDLDVAYCKTTLDDSNRYKGIKSKQKNGETKYVYFYEGLKNLKTDEMSNLDERKRRRKIKRIKKR